MPTLLNITASPRGAFSISRLLGERYVSRWLAKHPGGTVISRNLMEPAIPYMNVDWIGGVYAPPALPRTAEMQRALHLSAELIDELMCCDEVLITTPMYNFSIPAVLKSWIDYLVRPGYTFALTPGWPGMLEDRPVRVIVANRETLYEKDDQATPVIKRAFQFMGVTDVRSMLAGGSIHVNRGDVKAADHVARFEDAIAAMLPS